MTLGLDSGRIYDSWEAMIDADSMLPITQRMELLTIVTPNLTPNHIHVPVSAVALETGYHVFCEKPLASSLKEAQELVGVHEATGYLFGLAHTYCSYPKVWQAWCKTARSIRFARFT